MPDKNQGKMEEGTDRGIYEQVKRLDGQVVTGGGSPRQFGQKKTYRLLVSHCKNNGRRCA